MRAIANPVAALLEPGYCVDRYELLAKIGQGGMASVWLARTQDDATGDSFFAIKTILPEHAGDDQLRKMMLDEARIARSFARPGSSRPKTSCLPCSNDPRSAGGRCRPSPSGSCTVGRSAQSSSPGRSP